MKKRDFIKYLCSFLFLLISLVISDSVYAASEDAMGFTYENKIPDNQIGDHTYFELKVKPGDSQTLVTQITNTTDKPMIIKVNISDATTSSAGNIDYGASKDKLLGKNTLSIKEMIDAPTQIKLKAKETKDIKMKLKVPKKEFNGIVLGGIQLKQLDEEKKKKDKDRFALDSEYSYIYSISIRENDKKIESELISSGSKYNQIAYTMLENNSQEIISNLKIETLVMKSDSDKVIKDFKVDGYRIAPNSQLELPLEGTENLAIGKYRTQTTASVANKKWKFEDEFEVTEKSKQEVVPSIDIDSKGKSLNWLVIILIIASFVLVTAGIYFMLNRKNSNKRKVSRK